MTILQQRAFSSTNQNYICHVGNVSAGSTITVTASDGQALTTCYAYALIMMHGKQLISF